MLPIEVGLKLKSVISTQEDVNREELDEEIEDDKFLMELDEEIKEDGVSDVDSPIESGKEALHQHKMVGLKELVFYEDGEPIIYGEAGDLKFRIKTAPHDRFRREGNNLHTTVTITLVLKARKYDVGKAKYVYRMND